MARTIIEISVEDVEKRLFPSKHYVYIILVKWSDGTVSVVYRRYSKFFSFQTKLLDEFPEEAGGNDPANRIIPFIPGKILFGRSHIEKVALKRKKPIDDYCKTLISLPSRISQCQLVLQFFETKADDLSPKRKQSVKEQSAAEITEPLQLDQYTAIADYKKEQKNEVDLYEGMLVEVIDKKETGWWFVNVDQEQGWVPGSYLKKTDGRTEEPMHATPTEEAYSVIQSYTAALSDEITLTKGTNVTVVRKSLDGWWHIRYSGREGMAPAMYLRRPDTLARSKIRIALTENSCAMQGPGKVPTRLQKHSLPPRRKSIPVSQQKAGPAKPPRPAAPPVIEYYTTQQFEDLYNRDGISFSKDQRVQVIEKSSTGWWYVNIEGREGWAPQNYISSRKKSADTSRKTSKPNKPNKPPRRQSSSSPVIQKKLSHTKQYPVTKHSEAKIPIQTAISELQKQFNKVVDTQDSMANTRGVYRAVADYSDPDTGFSICEGHEMVVTEVGPNNWWLVDCYGHVGWAPSTYLERVT